MKIQLKEKKLPKVMKLKIQKIKQENRIMKTFWRVLKLKIIIIGRNIKVK